MAKFEINWLEDQSDDGFINEIRRVAAKFPNQRLTLENFDQHAKIGSTAVKRRFGSWALATRKAGLAEALPDYSEAEIEKDILLVSELFPTDDFTLALYRTKGRYSGSVIKRKFGGWSHALEHAGIGHRYVGPIVTDRMRRQNRQDISDDELLDEIRRVVHHLGKDAVSGADIVANSEITWSQMCGRFGSAAAAIKSAGFKQVPHGRRYTDDEVFENLLLVWTHYGRPPKALEMDTPPSSVGKNAYLKRFGGWRAALRAFIERANSNQNDTADTVALAIDSAELEIPEDSHAPKIDPLEVRAAYSRVSKLKSYPTKARPEDRREPALGLRFKVLSRDNFKCVLCGDHPASNSECKLHVDHITPYSKGGKTVEANLRCLCSNCNIGRGNRH